MTAGFPMPCLQWAAYADDAVPKSAGTNPWFVGIHLPGKEKIGTRVERALPLRPVMWPTLLNVAAYSVLAFLVMTGVAAFRAGRRRRRGQCARCGYTVAGLTVCPECGNPTQG